MKTGLKLLILFADLAAVSVNFFLVYFFLKNVSPAYPCDFITSADIIKSPGSLELYLDAYFTAVLIWAVIFHWRRAYRDLYTQTYGMAARQLIGIGLIFTFIFTSACFLLKFAFLSRVFLLLYAVTSVLWLIVIHGFFLHGLIRARKAGDDIRYIILAGSGRRAQEFISHLAKNKEWGYRLIGILDIEPPMKGEKVAGYPVIGTLQDLPDILEKQVVDEVFFITPRNWLEEVRKCILYCEAVGVPATISTDLFDLEIASAFPKKLEGKTYLTVETQSPKGWELLIKRVFDICVSASVLIITSPILLIVACAVKWTSPGPVFFKQIRSGKNGRRFYLYKFRSMVANAEAQLAELKDKNEMSGPVFKMTHDPRITKVGKFLRKTSLDEFPQFFNVLKGDMSVVGPRPPLPAEVEKYEPWQRRRLSLKPGITCIWQVSGRNQIDFEQWMDMDLRYIDNWSLWLDVKILFLTGFAMINGSGK